MPNHLKADFWEEYGKALESNEFREDFAERIGLKPTTVYQKVYERRRSGWNIPQLPCKGGDSMSGRERFASIMENLGITQGAPKHHKPRKKAAPKPVETEVEEQLPPPPEPEVTEEDTPMGDILDQLLS